MANKLHTSQKNQDIFASLGQSIRLQPYILSKLAIPMSAAPNMFPKREDDVPYQAVEVRFGKSKIEEDAEPYQLENPSYAVG